MTRPRRFRLDSATAGEMAWIRTYIEARCIARRFQPFAPVRAHRLLLHWWAAGHDPRRAMLRCDLCSGHGIYDATCIDGEPCECPSCNGSGRYDLPHADWRWDRVQ
jgi:hypothetical protein